MILANGGSVVTLTDAMIEAGKSREGGYSSKQIGLLGLQRATQGWKQSVIGRQIPESDYQEFLGLKDQHLKNRQPRKPKTERSPRHHNLVKKAPKTKKPKSVPAKDTGRKGLLAFVPIDFEIPYEQQYCHPNWQRMRLYVFRRDDFACTKCAARHKTLHVHHKKYIKGRFVWEIDPKHLITVCDDCHDKLHHGKLSGH